jgi:hypothetical protein
MDSVHQVVAAGNSNQVLRYVAQVDVKDDERASLKVSLSDVEKSSALLKILKIDLKSGEDDTLLQAFSTE